MGFDGWRFDFVKGYGGQHVREYIEATSPSLAVGEFWDDCAYTESKIEFDQVLGPAHCHSTCGTHLEPSTATM